MRHPLLACLPGLALLLTAASQARAQPAPRVAVRLDYLRGPGAEACPATADALRDEIARGMGYDPFDPGAPERLAVEITHGTRGWAAKLDPPAGSGAPPWTFRRAAGNCEAFVGSLASALRGWLLQGAPGKLPTNGPLFRVEYDDDPPGRVPGPAPVPAPALVVAPEPRHDSAQLPPAPAAAKRLGGWCFSLTTPAQV